MGDLSSRTLLVVERLKIDMLFPGGARRRITATIIPLLPSNPLACTRTVGPASSAAHLRLTPALATARKAAAQHAGHLAKGCCRRCFQRQKVSGRPCESPVAACAWGSWSKSRTGHRASELFCSACTSFSRTPAPSWQRGIQLTLRAGRALLGLLISSRISREASPARPAFGLQDWSTNTQKLRQTSLVARGTPWKAQG